MTARTDGILDRVRTPADVKALPAADLPRLAAGPVFQVSGQLMAMTFSIMMCSRRLWSVSAAL